MAWKNRVSFTAKFVFETEANKLSMIQDLAKNYCDEAFKSCKELEADLYSVDFQDDLEVIHETSQTVGTPDFKK